MKLFSALPCVCLLALALPQDSMAHRVNVFAWASSGYLEIESGFSGGTACKGCRADAVDKATGRVIFTTVTDDAGRARVAITEEMLACPTGLELRLNAGEGHRNTWSVDHAELLEAAPTLAQGVADGTQVIASVAIDPAAAQQDKAEEAEVANGRSEKAHVTAASAQNAAGLTTTLTRAEMELLVRDAVSQEIAPLRRELAQRSQTDPGLREILGGIGWLVGLAGLATWWRSRASGKKSS